jgi:nucleoid DNA-binding protein
MKPLSESLMDLAVRVKEFEGSSAGARDKSRAALQARREKLTATLEHEGHEFEKTAADLRDAAQHWWSDTQEALERQISVMRADFDKWQASIRAQRTARPPELAEPVNKD